MKWLTTKQKEYADMIVKTNAHSPFIMQMMIGTQMTANQLTEFNTMLKPLGKKLTRKKHDYTLKNIP